MASIIIPGKWTSQPQVPVEIDWANPLTRGLGVCSTLSGNAFDVVNKKQIATVGGVSNDVDVVPAKKTDGSTGYLSIPSAHYALSTAEWTYAVTARKIGVTYLHLVSAWANSSVNRNIYFAVDNGVLYCDIPYKQAILSTAAPSGRNRYLVTRNGNVVSLYINGKYITQGTVSTTQESATETRIGANTGSSGYSAATYNDFRAWNRGFSAEEAASEFSNPWQIFRPLTRRIYVDVPVASGDTSLVVEESHHFHLVDNVTLTGVGGDTSLVVQDAGHAHAVDAHVLIAASVLATQEAAHGHAAEAPTVTVASYLVVQEATHGHAAESVTLGTADTIYLTVADATSSHAVDATALTVASYLSVNDATHAHINDDVALASLTHLLVQDALHSHTSREWIDVDVNPRSVLALQRLLMHDAETRRLTGKAVNRNLLNRATQ